MEAPRIGPDGHVDQVVAEQEGQQETERSGQGPEAILMARG